ncbi:MAG: hypothetical protein U9N02_07365 [Campylobacterota bacterium]|nr:hypothetical protein [Campylobacterota bacterium]
MTYTTNNNDFEGFNFITNGKDIIAGEPENLVTYDDGSGLTGDFSEEDTYFNDDMIVAEKELDLILEEV